VSTNSFPSSSRWVVYSNLSSPGRCSISGVSNSCPSTAATTWYSFLRRATTTMGAVSPPAGERVDDAGALARDTSGVDLASKTKTSIVSPQHANPKRTDDASTLAKDLLGVSLVLEITVQSVPDSTSSSSVDQEVPSVFHPVPFRFSFDPPSDPASVDAFIKGIS
jgi:hypothetical protein